MNLFEEVTAISNSSLAQAKYEFDNIASEIKLTALTGGREVLITGNISEPVKSELLGQGFVIRCEYLAGKLFGYIIKW